MSITTISSREFNQNLAKAKRAAANGPVFITDRGKPAYVLISIEAWEKATNPQANIVELLAMPNDIDFEPPRLDDLGIKLPVLS